MRREEKKEEKKKRSTRKAKVWNFVWKLYGIYICLDYVRIISMKKKCMEWYGIDV